jgi:predicted O-linked N-acetylglucosamine transferase (SPINDLY family)
MPTPQELRSLFAKVLTLQDEGKPNDAVALLARLMPVDDSPMPRILSAIMLPQIYESAGAIDDWRNRAVGLLNDLYLSGFRMDLNQMLAIPWFSLAYQGKSDIEPMKLLASLYRAPAQRRLGAVKARRVDGRIRLGILSSYFRANHTIGKLTCGLIATLDREEFFVTVFSCGRHDDDVARLIQDQADAFVELPTDLPLARSLIAGQKLDALYFTDIGMAPQSYTLAHTRFAPVQCVTWGHPDTTGIPTVDYFISSEALDVPDAQQHYSEKLVRLPNLAVYYYRPALPASPGNRAQFQLPEGCNLYGIPQTLIKIHPNFDSILRQILTRDPTGLLVLLSGNRPGWDQMLISRFARSMPDAVNRVRFVPRQDFEGFMRLNSICDVLLDPPDFGGGNTSYEALAMGIPIVTWPSPFLRGRITYAMYQAMGMDDCIANSAEQYVDLAVGLATDKTRRAEVSRKILRTNSVLYENSAGIRELEQFFKSVCAI